MVKKYPIYQMIGVLLSLSILPAFAKDLHIENIPGIDSFTGLNDKRSLHQYLCKLQHDDHPLIYPLSIVTFSSKEDPIEARDLLLRKSQDTLIKESSNVHQWTLLLPETPKEGAEVVISRLKYHLDDFQLSNLSEITSESKLKQSDKKYLKILERYQSTEQSYSLVFLDIDGFKKINTEQGYKEGDKVIKSLAKLIQHNLRKTDFIARFGGDEFVIVLKNSNSQSAKKVVRRLQEAATKLDLSFSAGVVSVSRKMDAELILEIGMKVCQTAKEQGKRDSDNGQLIFWSFD
ncbi:MAG: GGDEF domain-containing protein [Oligoflexales bacterium]|nr:GGDEF domain-containing protein [Oligoflexales bacterium]